MRSCLGTRQAPAVQKFVGEQYARLLADLPRPVGAYQSQPQLFLGWHFEGCLEERPRSPAIGQLGGGLTRCRVDCCYAKSRGANETCCTALSNTPSDDEGRTWRLSQVAELLSRGWSCLLPERAKELLSRVHVNARDCINHYKDAEVKRSEPQFTSLDLFDPLSVRIIVRIHCWSGWRP